MTLVAWADCKSYCRQTSTGEDALFQVLYGVAVATAAREIGVPLAAPTSDYAVFIDPAQSMRLDRKPSRLMVQYPNDPKTIAIVDTDGDTIDPSNYTTLETATTGFIDAIPGFYFDNGPYQITAKVGLDQDPTYAGAIEGILNGLILDLVADLYQRRNPAATGETEGGGAGTQYGPDAVPPRILAALHRLSPILEP